jgi:hypothetical protein
MEESVESVSVGCVSCPHISPLWTNPDGLYLGAGESYREKLPRQYSEMYLCAILGVQLSNLWLRGESRSSVMSPYRFYLQ